MVNAFPINNGDSGQSSSVQSSNIYASDIQDIQQESSVDLEEYIDSSMPEEELDIKQHKLTIFIGGGVLLISIAVAVIALTVITPSVAQSIVLGGAVAGLIVGGSSFLKSLIKIIYSKLKKEDDLSYISKNAKLTLLIGFGLTIFGFLSKLTVISIPEMGDFGQILEKIGSTACDMGTFSIFTAMTQLLYNKLFMKNLEKEIAIDENSKSNENKKEVLNAVLVLSIGIGLSVLGISLLLIGSLMLSGTDQVLALAFATPFLATGISLVMKNIINFPWQSVKELFEKSLSEKEKNNLTSEVLRKQKEINNNLLINGSIDGIEKESKTKEINTSNFSLEKKITLAVSVFFLLLALSLVLTSVFVPGPVFQIKLLSTVGGVVLATSLPSMISGISALAVYIKNKNYWFNKVKVKNNKILCRASITDNLEDSEKLIDLETIVEQQKKLDQKFESKMLIILAGLSILIGIGFMLLSLIPGSFSVAGIIAVGSPFLIAGGLLLLEKTVSLLREELHRINIKKEKRKKRISHFPDFVKEAMQEV